jgi:hypothetical protein
LYFCFAQFFAQERAFSVWFAINNRSLRMQRSNSDAVLAAPFSSAELLRLLSRDHLTQAAAKIKQLHVENEPRITCDGRTR